MLIMGQVLGKVISLLITLKLYTSSMKQVPFCLFHFTGEETEEALKSEVVCSESELEFKPGFVNSRLFKKIFGSLNFIYSFIHSFCGTGN